MAIPVGISDRHAAEYARWASNRCPKRQILVDWSGGRSSEEEVNKQ